MNTKGIGFGMKGNKDLNMMLVDISRSYFHVEARREVYIQLPEEDHEEGMCGLLQMSMYGTRDAAQHWEIKYTSVLSEMGFTQGRSNPCVFKGPKKQIVDCGAWRRLYCTS